MTRPGRRTPQRSRRTPLLSLRLRSSPSANRPATATFRGHEGYPDSSLPVPGYLRHRRPQLARSLPPSYQLDTPADIRLPPRMIDKQQAAPNREGGRFRINATASAAPERIGARIQLEALARRS